MLLKIIALAISLLGLSEVENIIHTKSGSTEKVVILCPNGQITIERAVLGVLTNTFSPMVITNYSLPPNIQLLPNIVPGLSTTLPNYPAPRTTFQTPEAVQP